MFLLRDVADQPGSLAKLVNCVAEMGTNIIQTSHTRMNPALAISEVDVELELETRGFEHREQILTQIVAQGFEIVTYY